MLHKTSLFSRNNVEYAKHGPFPGSGNGKLLIQLIDFSSLVQTMMKVFIEVISTKDQSNIVNWICEYYSTHDLSLNHNVYEKECSP